MTQETKVAEELISHRLVFPNDANPSGYMFGGRVMEIMDSSAGMAAGRYSSTVNAVTASVEALRFQLPIHIGDVIKTVSKVVFTGRTSMIVRVDVFRFEQGLDPGSLCTNAHFVFVALDEDRKSTPVPPLAVTSDADRKAWAIAEAVREQALRIRSMQAET